jgi:hypothetical protein
VDAEFAFHESMRVRELIDQGHTEAEAFKRARKEFGDVERARRQLTRATWRRESRGRARRCWRKRFRTCGSERVF